MAASGSVREDALSLSKSLYTERLGTGHIRDNESNGRDVESIVAEHYGGVVAEDRINPFDVVTERALIEVKSCKLKTITKRLAEKVYFITGRFMVCPNSHQRLKAEAEQQGKDFFYVFVLREPETSSKPNNGIRIVDMKEVPWSFIDKILATAKTTRRGKDGVENVCIRSEKIFGQKRLLP